MPYFTCEDEVRRILDELPSENPCIDYKQIPYVDDKKYELIIDVLALLNCEEAAGYDRYIIIGVEERNHQYKRIGLKPTMPTMPDDNELQVLFNKIRPRPVIHTGIVAHANELFGYIHILNSNLSRTYEVSTTYPDTKHYIHEGQAFIRVGTTKRVMTQEDRRRIETQVLNKYTPASPLTNKPIISSESTSLSIDLIAALVGVWNSEYSGDKEVIERLSSVHYEDWETECQKLLASGDSHITFSESQWSYTDHIETLVTNAKSYFNSHLSVFFNLLYEALNSSDYKFDKPNDIRYISTANEPKGKYSNGLRESLVLSFVNIATKDKEFTSCTKSFIRNEAYNVINKLILEGTWQVFATLGWQLVTISQAEPNAFLVSLQTMLKKPNNAIEELLAEKEHGIVTTGYYYGLVAALQTLTWCERYFATSAEILFRLTRITKEIENDFIVVFLPWYPQTEAPITTRVGAIKHLVGEYGVECWNVIFELMPRQTSTGRDIEPPKFIQGTYERKKVLMDEYWSTSEQYLEELFKLALTSKEHCTKLVDLLDDVNRKMFDKILDYLDTTYKLDDNDSDRYFIWDKLLSFTERHRYFSESDWALPEELLIKIDGLIDVIIPRNIDIVESRLFKKEQYDLLRSNRNSLEGEAELQAQQAASIKRIFNERKLQGVFQFAEMVGSPQIVGNVLAGLALTRIDEEYTLDQLISDNDTLKILAKSYCNAKNRLNPDNWLTSLDILAMFVKKRIMILSSIYICKAVLDIVLTLPPAEQNEYWLLASQWADESGITTQTIVGLIGANKLEQALEILVRIIDDGRLDSTDLAYYVLEANRNGTSYRSQMWSYYINQVFEWLQKDMSPDNIQKLTQFEWYYHPIFSHEGQAKALEYTLSSSPEDFIAVLKLLFKSHTELDSVEESSEDVEDDGDEGIVDTNPAREYLAHNAWNVLYHWRWTPGKLVDGSFDPEAFANWISSVKLLSAQIELNDIAMQYIGHVLYYAPTSQDGFFIHKTVAATLDKVENEHIRRGYRTEAFNARGVYNYDPSGQQEDELAKLWNERALSAESFGYTQFGKTLRDIAQDFLNQKEHY